MGMDMDNMDPQHHQLAGQDPDQPSSGQEVAAATQDASQDTQQQQPASGSQDKPHHPSKKKKKGRSRCLQCRRKLNAAMILAGACRCGGIFCTAHHHSTDHKCGFDYKAKAAQEILQSNPVVVAPKVEKI